MTTNIIYHDFRQETASQPTYFTNEALRKGRRFLKVVSNLNPTLNAACAYLCGICMALSMFAFLMIALYA